MGRKLRILARTVLVAPLLVALVLVELIAVPSALADTARERAGKHVIDGDQLKVQAEEAKADGDSSKAMRLFDAAAEEYQAAYDLVPHPLMLYNLGQVARLAGKQQEALDYYNEFLESSPNGEAADFAETYVRILERSLERRRAREEKDADDDDDDDDDEEVMDFDDGTDDPFTEDKDSKGKSDPGTSFRYAGIGLASAGVVSIAIGVTFGLEAQSISNCLTNYPSDCDSTFPDDRWTDEALKLEKKGQSASGKMVAFTSLGAVAIIAGGALYYMGESKSKESKAGAVTVVPQVGRESVGFGLSGSF